MCYQIEGYWKVRVVCMAIIILLAVALYLTGRADSYATNTANDISSIAADRFGIIA